MVVNKMIKFFNNKKRGFTLIEMMVAVSLFVIVAFIVVSTLLTLSYSYKKAQSMRLLMDNLNFTIQSISLNLREGIKYNDGGVCSDGSCVKFVPIDVWFGKSGPLTASDFSCYSQTNDNKGIEKCTGSCPCSGSGQKIVSPEIDIQKLNFEVTGNGDRKKVRILIKGLAGSGKNQADFFIQNTISQRSPD